MVMSYCRRAQARRQPGKSFSLLFTVRKFRILCVDNFPSCRMHPMLTDRCVQLARSSLSPSMNFGPANISVFDGT